MPQHRIEFICNTPEGKLKTITVTVEADARKDRLATLTRQMRAVLQATMFAENPLTIEHCRDYPVPTQ